MDNKNFQGTWVILGYISSLFGGVIGMFIGSILISAKKTLPDGRVVYVFNKGNRKHGKIILYLGSTILILSILFLMNWFFLEKVLFGKPSK
jgi:5-bromo-4-chloroindolyl phosphate hydrolysis protein